MGKNSKLYEFSEENTKQISFDNSNVSSIQTPYSPEINEKEFKLNNCEKNSEVYSESEHIYIKGIVEKNGGIGTTNGSALSPPETEDKEEIEPFKELNLQNYISPTLPEMASEKYTEPVGEIDKGEKVKLSRWKYITWLLIVIFAMCSLIVYAIGIIDGLSASDVSIPVLLLREVFGTGVSEIPANSSLPPLPQIPGTAVKPGEIPGASEEETLPDVPNNPSVDEGTSFPIQLTDLSVSVEDKFTLINETPYEPDIQTLATAPMEIPSISEIYKKYGEDAPIVLIIHTHGSEAYSAEGAEEYQSSESFRSYNPDETVVTVGRTFKEVLQSQGINVIHNETMFDIKDFNTAYSQAASEIKNCTQKYPSISYVIDIHRDALITSEGVNLKPAAKINDISTAQVMLVVGTDHGGSGHTGWQDNLNLASKLQEKMTEQYPGVMRSINLRSPSFNQQYTKGSLLIEVGAAGNSLSEAVNAALLLSKTFSDIIK